MKPMEFYMFAIEANYPTESTLDLFSHTISDDSDSMNEEKALELCQQHCQTEKFNFSMQCGDAYPPAEFTWNEYKGYILTTKDGTDPYYYAVYFTKHKSPITDKVMAVNVIKELNDSIELMNNRKQQIAKEIFFKNKHQDPLILKEEKS